MEQDIHRDEFEAFLREKTDEYNLYPSDEVWGGIERKLHPKRKWPYVAAALLLLGIGVTTQTVVDFSGQDKFAVQSPEPAQKNEQNRQVVSADRQTNTHTPEKVEERATGLPEKGRLAPFRVPGRRADVAAKPGLAQLDARPDNLADRGEGALSGSADLQPLIENRLEERQPAKVIPLPSAKTRKTGSAGPLKQPIGNSRSADFFNSLHKIGKRTMWQLYISPTVSYRQLIGQAGKTNFPMNMHTGYTANLGSSTDVNDAVTHKPALGVELGTALVYPVSKKFRIKAGLQLNVNNYEIEAYSYVPEIAPFSASTPGSFAPPVNTVSFYRNYNGFSRTWLRNSHFMVSVPLGAELTVLGNRRISFNVASTIQPTYMVSNQSYLISTNLKNYAIEPSLNRRWNMNAGAEAYLSVSSGSYKWVMGPQIRYQLLSSYKDKYPIREHLIDYGFKVGINKTLK